MKFLRSFDTYLLEHYPILWHSKIIYLLLAGIVFWLGFLGAGYLMVDLDLLKTESIYDYYTDSYACAIHSVLVIVALCIWALFFFRKNAIRHYYPLQRLYFTRLFLCLLIGFLPLVSVFVPFQYGVRLKTRSLLDLGQLHRDARAANLAKVFLPSGKGNYELGNRSYPKPFPIGSITYDRNSQTWGETSYFIDSLGNETVYRAIEHPENTVNVDGTEYQFFYDKTVSEPVHPCYDDNSYSVITQFLRPDSSLAVHRVSVLNYSGVQYPVSESKWRYFLQGWNYYDYYEYERRLDESDTEEFNRSYAPTIHRWVKNDEKDSIAGAIRAFEQVLDRYEIPYALDEKLIVGYLSEHDYANFNAYFISDYANKLYRDRFLRRMHALTTKSLHKIDIPVMNYGNDKLSQLYTNAANAYFFVQDPMLYVVLFGLAMAMALLFLVFDFTNFIQFLIAIPSAGVLSILTGLGVALILVSNHRNEKISIVFAFGIATLVLGLGIASVLMRFFNKKFAGVMLNLGYMLAPFYLGFFVLTMHIVTTVTVWDRCGSHEEYAFWKDLMTPWVLIGLAMVGSVSYFALIRKWYAKEE